VGKFGQGHVGASHLKPALDRREGVERLSEMGVRRRQCPAVLGDLPQNALGIDPRSPADPFILFDLRANQPVTRVSRLGNDGIGPCVAAPEPFCPVTTP
jgi:hypothetical protein